MSASVRVSAELAALGTLAVAAASIAIHILRRARRDPRERERRRLTVINRAGRMGDGYITDVSEQALYYTYSVSGVEYTASQEITELRELLPENLDTIIGPVTLKFLPANPGNSMVVCGNWFGIRAKQRRVFQKGA